MKKFLPALLVAVLCLSACAKTPTPPPKDPVEQKPPVTDPATPTVYDTAMKSIGIITARDAGGRKYSFTTGYALSADGKILTSYTAVEHCTSAEVSIDGKTYAITQVLAWDEDQNIAVLQCDGADLTPLPISDTIPQLRDTLYAFGSPVGADPAYGEGFVTAFTDDGFRHNALTESHAGGPILNASGQVVGYHAGKQTQGKPVGYPIVPLLQNLSYDTPKTLQELYTLDHADALQRMQRWLREKGADVDGYMTFQTSNEQETYFMGFSEDTQLLRVEYFHYYESGDVYGFHLEFSPQEEQWRYWSDYAFASGEEVYADGLIHATEFTSKTALTMENLTMESQRKQLGALNTAAMKSLLSWFHSNLSFYANAKAADFGFLWHGKT